MDKGDDDINDWRRERWWRGRWWCRDRILRRRRNDDDGNQSVNKDAMWWRRQCWWWSKYRSLEDDLQNTPMKTTMMTMTKKMKMTTTMTTTTMTTTTMMNDCIVHPSRSNLLSTLEANQVSWSPDLIAVRAIETGLLLNYTRGALSTQYRMSDCENFRIRFTFQSTWLQRQRIYLYSATIICMNKN